MFLFSRQLALTTVTGLALLCLSSPVWAADGSIRSIQYDPASRHFVIDVGGPVRATVNTLTIAGHKRVILDVENTEIGMGLPSDGELLQKLSRQMPSLRNVTVNQYGGSGRPIVRILFDIDSPLKTIRMVRNQGPTLELELNDSALAQQPVARPPASSVTTIRPPVETPNSEEPPPLRPAQPEAQASRTPSVDMVSQALYQQSVQELEAQKRQIASLQQQLAQANSEAKKAQTVSPAQIVELNATIARLSNELERQKAATANLDVLSRENQGLKSQLATLSKPDPSLNLKQAEIDRLQRLNRDLQGRLDQLQAQASASASKSPSTEDLKLTLVRMNQQYDILAQEAQSLRSENARLKTKPAGVSEIKDSDLQALRQQITMAQQSLNDSIRTINEQNKEIAYLRNQVSDVKSSMDASSREQIARLQSTQEEKESRIRELEKQLAAQSPSTSTQNELATLKRQLSQLSTQYKMDVDDLNQQLRKRNQQLEEREKQLDSVQAQAKQASELQRQVTALETQLSDALKQQALNKDSELKKKDAQIATLQTELASAKSLAGNLETELQGLKKTTAPNQEVVELKNTIARIQQENTTLQSSLAQLKANTPKQDETQLQQNQKLQARINNLQTELSNVKTQHEKALGEAKKLRQDLENQKKTATTKPSPSSANTTALQKQINELNTELANLRQENGDLKTRLGNASTAVSKASSSTNPEAQRHYTNGKASLIAGEVDKALDALKTAQLLDQDNSQYTIDYSIALAEKHQYAEAADLLRRYLQRNPLDRDAYNQLGKIYLLNDQPDAANQAFSRAIPVSTLNNYATALKKQGKLTEAEEIFKTALKLNPRDSEILFNLGNLYNANNQLELARNNYLQALQYKPDFAEAHYNLGLIYSKLGDRTQAISHLEKFLQLSPNARNAETIRAYVQKLKV